MSYKIRTSQGPKIKEIALCERPRERLLEMGAKSLSNAELMAIIISCGTKNESAIALAQRVLALENGNLSMLSNYSPEEFEKISGIGRATACKIAAAIELGVRVSTTKRLALDISNAKSIADYCDDLRHMTKEVFRVVLINTKLKIISKIDVSLGGISSASAAAREVFQEAIRKGAAAIILVHNHPSGDPNPSSTDIATTKELLASSHIVGISILDHIIIGDGSYFSFKENHIVF